MSHRQGGSFQKTVLCFSIVQCCKKACFTHLQHGAHAEKRRSTWTLLAYPKDKGPMWLLGGWKGPKRHLDIEALYGLSTSGGYPSLIGSSGRFWRTIEPVVWWFELLTLQIISYFIYCNPSLLVPKGRDPGESWQFRLLMMSFVRARQRFESNRMAMSPSSGSA